MTLEGLSGAFLVLGIGYSIAIAAFIVEVVHGFMRKRNQTQIRRVNVKPKRQIINRFNRADKKKDKKIVKNTKSNPLVVNQQAETNIKMEDSTKKEVIDIKPNPLATNNQTKITTTKEKIGKNEVIDSIKLKPFAVSDVNQLEATTIKERVANHEVFNMKPKALVAAENQLELKAIANKEDAGKKGVVEIQSFCD